MPSHWSYAPAARQIRVDTAAAKGAATSVETHPVIDATAKIVGSVAWPVVLLIVAIVFRKSIGAFLDGLGSRVTKLSVFKIELELASAGTSTGPVLQELRDMSRAAVADSAGDLFRQIRDSTPAEYAVIDLGAGMEWITSRVFLAASLLERMRGLRCLVFVESRGGVECRFVALAKPSVIRWSLSRDYQWLEAAFDVASHEAIQLAVQSAPQLAAHQTTASVISRSAPNMTIPLQSLLSQPPTIKSQTGALTSDAAEILSRRFIGSLQAFGPPPAGSATEWTQLSGYSERATFVTSAMLRDWLSADAFDAQMPEMRDETQRKRTSAALRRPGDFVALVDTEGRFKRLVNRGKLLESVAEGLSAEPG